MRSFVYLEHLTKAFEEDCCNGLHPQRMDSFSLAHEVPITFCKANNSFSSTFTCPFALISLWTSLTQALFPGEVFQMDFTFSAMCVVSWTPVLNNNNEIKQLQCPAFHLLKLQKTHLGIWLLHSPHRPLSHTISFHPGQTGGLGTVNTCAGPSPARLTRAYRNNWGFKKYLQNEKR